MRKLLLAPLALVLAAAAVAPAGPARPHAALAATSGVTDLGTLGGTTSSAMAIDSRGNVVGDSTVASGANHGFYWSASAGKMTDLPTLGGAVSSANALYENGTTTSIAGWADYSSTAHHAALWTIDSSGNVSSQDLGALGGQNSSANNMDRDTGATVVGLADTGPAAHHAFYWTAAGGMVDIGTLGGTNSDALAVAGDFVTGTSQLSGDATSDAFLYSISKKTLTDLGSLGGAKSAGSWVSGDGSQVYGYSDSKQNPRRAVEWLNGTAQDLGNLGGTQAQVYGVTGSYAVGRSTMANNAWEAAVFVNGEALDLNSALGPGSGWRLFNAQDVRSVTSGTGTVPTIVGGGIINGANHAFSMPLPSSGLTKGGTFHPVTPYRILDTRTTSNTLGAGQTLTLQVAGTNPPSGSGGVPASGVMAAALNVTVTNTTAASYLSLYPGTQRPVSSNLNWVPGETKPNQVQVSLDYTGAVTIYNLTGSVDVVVDVEGWFSTPDNAAGPDGLYKPVAPIRVIDTRDTHQTMGPGSTLTVPLGIGAGQAEAVTMNVTVTNTTSDGYLSVWPAGASQPLASSLNWTAGETVPNRVTSSVSSSGAVQLYNAFGYTDVVIDVNGWYGNASSTAGGSRFVPTIPFRIRDTRSWPYSPNTGSSWDEAVTSILSYGYPEAAAAVVLNVTVTDTQFPSYFTLYPTDAPSRPNASDLNWMPGQTVANLTPVSLGSTGAFRTYNLAGAMNAIFDVEGYYR